MTITDVVELRQVGWEITSPLEAPRAICRHRVDPLRFS